MCAAERSVTNLLVRIQRATFTCCVVSVSMGVLNVFIGGGGRAIKTARRGRMPSSSQQLRHFCVWPTWGAASTPPPPPPPLAPLPPAPHPTRGRVCADLFVFANMCARACVCAAAHAHTCACVFVHTMVRVFVRACVHACLRTCVISQNCTSIESSNCRGLLCSLYRTIEALSGADSGCVMLPTSGQKTN